jgi:hypothetical protein
VLLAALSFSCSSEPAGPTPTPEGEDAQGNEDEVGAAELAALDKAKAAAKTLGEGLKEKLTEALAKGGPVDALGVCGDIAHSMGEEIKEQHKVRVGRSSLRLRNPKNAGPDWVTSWLEEQGERSFEGTKGQSFVSDTPEGTRARFIVPIGVAPLCVTCHGPRESLSPDVLAALGERYAQDKATGYAPGELRGAIWAEAPVD